MMLQNGNGQEMVPASEIQIMYTQYSCWVLLKSEPPKCNFGKNWKILHRIFYPLKENLFFLENILSGALTIYIETCFEGLKFGFRHDIVLVKSFCTGGILLTLNQNVLKKLTFTKKIYHFCINKTYTQYSP